MTEKIVLFDIDYTLFNTELLRENLYGKLAEDLGYEKNELENIGRDIYEEMAGQLGFFDPKRFAQKLARKINRQSETEKIEKALWDRQNFEGNFYEEVEEVLKALSRLVKVGIFSKGYDQFQRAKLVAIEHLLKKEHTHITVSKHIMLPELLAMYETNKLYIVDDALDILYEAKKLNKDLFAIWIKRGRYAEKQKPIAGFKPDATVLDLKDIVSIVKAN